jgi:hypothetical protein
LRRSLMLNSVRSVFHLKHLLYYYRMQFSSAPFFTLSSMRYALCVFLIITEKPEPGLRNVLTKQMKAPQHPLGR